jgi:8-amino-7-oxononanoate synthase
MANMFGMLEDSKHALLASLRGRKPVRAAQATTAPQTRRPPPGDPGLYDELGLKRRIGEALSLPQMFFLEHEGVGGPVTRIGGRDCVNFVSYDYCGLNRDRRVQQAAIDAIGRYGVSVGASRINGGARPPHARLEAALAAHYGTEDAVIMVSGHATNVTTISCLFGPGDLVVHDALAHNSIVQGCMLSGARRLGFPHNDLAALDRTLAEARPRARQALIAVEGQYGMDGDVPDLPGLVAIARRYDAYLMVDEAHALGVLGATGRGLSEHSGVPAHEVDIWMGTLSKTLAGCGGFIAGSAPMIDCLRGWAAGSVYSVGTPSPVAAASLAALEILHAEPDRVARLQRNSRTFLAEARAAGFDTSGSIGSGIVPVIIGSAITTARVAGMLLERGLFVLPVLPPGVPDGSSRLRFFITEGHTEAQIRDAVRMTAEVLAKARSEKLKVGLELLQEAARRLRG